MSKTKTLNLIGISTCLLGIFLVALAFLFKFHGNYAVMLIGLIFISLSLIVGIIKHIYRARRRKMRTKKRKKRKVYTAKTLTPLAETDGYVKSNFDSSFVFQNKTEDQHIYQTYSITPKSNIRKKRRKHRKHK